MGRVKKKWNDNDPKKNQTTLLQFHGFERSTTAASSENTSQKKCTKHFKCQFCDFPFAHDGARKMHQSWCKQKPKKPENVEVFPSNSNTLILPIIGDILENVCTIATPGGWNLAAIFDRQSTSKRFHEAFKPR